MVYVGKKLGNLQSENIAFTMYVFDSQSRRYGKWLAQIQIVLNLHYNSSFSNNYIHRDLNRGPSKNILKKYQKYLQNLKLPSPLNSTQENYLTNFFLFFSHLIVTMSMAGASHSQINKSKELCQSMFQV
jgi:hypothetical protein